MTKFRPCIDLHDGKVKQIVGSTLRSETTAENSEAPTLASATNFETTKPSADYARMYQDDRLDGGHVIMLGPNNAEAAQQALKAYPGGLQVGGGIKSSNAKEWMDCGASQIIVTSYVFHHGQVDYDRLDELLQVVGGPEKLVLDLSCRRNAHQDGEDGPYYVVTDKWQTFTQVAITPENLTKLAHYCCEFLVHGVDVEGKQCGILQDLVELLGKHSPIPVTYAGGIRSVEDIELIHQLGKGRVDFTVGSALDIFGGALPYRQVVEWHHRHNTKESQEKDTTTTD